MLMAGPRAGVRSGHAKIIWLSKIHAFSNAWTIEPSGLSSVFCGAVAYAKKKGAKIVEGYPIDMQTEKLAGQKLSSYAGYMGLLLFFVKLVFWKRVALRKHN
jgi:hypothetical protein